MYFGRYLRRGGLLLTLTRTLTLNDDRDGIIRWGVIVKVGRTSEMLQVVFVARIQKRCGCASRRQALSALEVSRRHIPSSTPNLAVERFLILGTKTCGVGLYLGRTWGELDICLMRDAIALPEIA